MKEKVIELNEEALKGNDIYFNISQVDSHYPLHFHKFYEIELCVAGSGTQVINGNTYEINTNTLFIYHINDYHEIFAKEPLTFYNIAFNSIDIDVDTIEEFLNYQNEIVIELTPHKLQQTLDVMNLMRDIFNSQRSYKKQIISYLLNALLLIVIGKKKKDIHKTNTLTNSVLQYIHKNFASSPSLDEIASYSGYQKNYFCDIFKKKIGVTYIEYLTEYKINYSKKLLKIDKKTIKEIAFECGFDSASNYIREFKKRNNITPKQYRILHSS